MNLRPWAIVLISILFSTFVGGGLKTVFFSSELQEWVKKQAHSRNLKISFKSAHVSLADGIWPRLGIQLTEVFLKGEDPCLFDGELEVDHVYLPFAMKSLFGGPLAWHFKSFEAHHGIFTEDKFICSESQESQKKRRAKETPRDLALNWVDVLRDSAKADWFKKFIDSEKNFHSLKMDRFLIARSFNNSSQTLFELKDFKVFTKDRSVEVLSDLNFYKNYHGLETFNSVRSKLTISPQKILLSSVGSLLEGRVYLDANINVLDNKFEQLRLTLRNIPFSAFLNVVNGFRKEPFEKLEISRFRKDWLSTSLFFKGPVSQVFYGPYKVSSSRIIGQVGEVVADPFSFHTRPRLSTKNLELRFSRTPTIYVFHLLTLPPVKNNIIKSGNFNLHVKVHSEKNIDLSGRWSSFSTASHKKEQMMTFPFSGRLSNEILNLKTKLIQFKKGELRGLIDMRYFLKNKKLQINASIEKLKTLKWQVQGASLSTEWNVHKKLGSLKSPDESVESVHSASGSFFIYKITPFKQDFQQAIYPITMNKIFKNKPFGFSRLGGEFVVSNMGKIDFQRFEGELQQLDFRLSNFSYYKKKLEGLLLLTDIERSKYLWKVSGLFEQPQIQLVSPIAEMQAKTPLAQRNKAFLINYYSETNIKNIRELGREVLKKAKEVIPLKSSETSEKNL